MRKDEFPIVDKYCRQETIKELEKIRAEIAENGNSDINTQTIISILDKHIRRINNDKSRSNTHH